MNYTKGEWEVITYPTPRLKGKFYVGTDNYVLAETDTKGNAHLIAASPDLSEACKAQHEAIDILFAMLIEKDHTFFPSKSGKPWEAIVQGNKALDKAEGK